MISRWHISIDVSDHHHTSTLDQMGNKCTGTIGLNKHERWWATKLVRRILEM